MPFGAIITLVFMTIMFGGFGLVMLVLGISIPSGMLLIFGLISSIIGFTPLVIFIRKKLIKVRLLKKGTRIETDFLDVTYASYQINNFQPLLIRTQWYDASQNLIYQFKSSPLSKDPRPYVHTDMKIPVMINPNNPKQYYMDLESTPVLKEFLRQ